MNKRSVGADYEQIAADYLEKNGYRILERNYRIRLGEIDIIAEQNDELVFVEVKYRKTNSFGDALSAVDVRKQRKISQVALFYYSSRGYQTGKACRFDVIGISGDGGLSHIRNAFEA